MGSLFLWKGERNIMKTTPVFTGHWTEVIGRECIVKIGKNFFTGFFIKYYENENHPYEVMVRGRIKRLDEIYVEP